MTLFKILNFCLISFLNKYPQKIFFFQHYPNFWRYIRTFLRFTKEDEEVRKQALIFAPARYIRSLDIISEAKCVLLRRSGRIQKSLVFVSARYILLKRFSSTKRQRLGVSNLFCEVFFRKRSVHILKTLRCLSLRYSADFGRSRLVSLLFKIYNLCEFLPNVIHPKRLMLQKFNLYRLWQFDKF